MSKELLLDPNYYYLIVVGVSFLFFQVCFYYLVPRISAPNNKYRSLTVVQKADWGSRVLSSIHAVLVCLVALYACLYSNDSWDVVWEGSIAVRTDCAFVVGFMLSDMIFMWLHFPFLEYGVYYLHHLLSITGFYYVSVYGVVTWLSIFRMFAEFSTPFVNQKYFFDMLQHSKTSNLYIANGVGMCLSFFLTRILFMPYYYYYLYQTYLLEDFHRLWLFMRVLLFSLSFGLDILNIIWFRKMCRGALKILKKRKQED